MSTFHVLASSLLILQASCPPRPTPTTSTERIPFGTFEVDLATTPGRTVGREVLIYAGTAVTSMTLDIDVRALGANERVSIGSGAATLIHEISEARRFTTDPIPGNVARIKIDSPSGRPRVFVEALTETRRSGPAIPGVEGELRNRMTSMPLTPNRSVDFAFSATQRTLFFTFRAPESGAFDVVYVGPGELRVRTVDFPLVPCVSPSPTPTPDPCADEFAIPAAGSSAPFRRISLTQGGMIHLAATNVGGVSGRGRVVVMPFAPQQALTFPSDQALHFLPTPIGVDRNPAAGTRGTDPRYDCVNYAGTSGLVALGPLLVPRIPAPCYDSHEGTDWSLTLGPLGQILRAPVTASASGVVLGVDATQADMCFPDITRGGAIVCFDPSANPPIVPPTDNFVLVRHDDGLLAYYVHGARGGAVVVPGQRVACGELLTPAASAGFSSGPHLHFELQDVGGPGAPPANLLIATIRGIGAQIDPFGPSRWRSVTLGVPSATCP